MTTIAHRLHEQGQTAFPTHPNRPYQAPGFGRKALLLGLMTASFDLFLILDIGGFTLRIHQILLCVALAATLQLTYSRQLFRAPVGIVWLMIWVAFIFAFIPNTVYLPRSLGYAFWLLLDVCILVVTVQLFGDGRWVELLLRNYLRAFVFVGGFGLLQLVLGLLHLPAPFVTQWLVYGAWPRLNGFSYEPSYFATYMLMGWVFSAWLIERDTYVFGRRLTRAAFLVSTAAIVLSTSRIGWAMMGVWGVGYAFRRLRQRTAMRLSPAFIVASLLCFGAACVWLAGSSGHLQKVLVTFAGGTGLYGTPAHSVDSRERNLGYTFAIFRKSPIVGYSLGGVASAIGSMQGGRITGNNDAKQSEGGAVFAEVLAASGIVGVIPFILYLATVISRPLRLAKTLDPATAVVLCGLVWALCMELVILQFNQNILRAYFWFHLGILSAVYVAIQGGSWRAIPGFADAR